MSESQVRRRSSLSRDYSSNSISSDHHADEGSNIQQHQHRRNQSSGVGQNGNPFGGSSTARTTTKLAHQTHSPRKSSSRLDFEAFTDHNDASIDDVEVLEMGGSSSGNGGSGLYSQLPGGGGSAAHRRSRGAGGNSGGTIFGLQRWQRNALLGFAAVVLLVYLVRTNGSPTSQRSGIAYTGEELAANKGKVPDSVSENDGVVDRPDWKEQVVGQDKKVEQGAAGKKQAGGPAPIQHGGSDGKCRLADGKPEISYALMIDAGSTGSRMHVYTFSNCLADGVSAEDAKDALPTLKDELFYPITPGLSSYKGDPKAAAKSLEKLMQEAVKAVPESERACTPVAVKATAGLRLLGKKESQDILDEVERYLKEEWPFHVVDDGVVIMDGKDEGVYAWITINYLLGLVGPGTSAGQSAAVMDLGGASTQIVFEPSFPSDSKLSPGDHVYDLSFASTDHTLYQHSHLGYGLMQARRSVHNLVAFTHVWQSTTKGKAMEWEDLSESDVIPNPCLIKDSRKTVLLDPPGRKAVTVTFVGTGAGFDACRRVVDVVMAKDALCEVEPCAFGGVYQPQLMETFGSGPIYALSYFYDRIVPLGLGHDSKPFTIADLRELSRDVCAGPHPSGRVSSSSKGWSRFKGNLEAMAELEDRPEYCLDLSFMYSLLSLGYELADSRELVTGKKINDIELGWALGAGIALLEHSSLKCRNPDN